MIASIDYARILNTTEQLTNMILHSDVMDEYKRAHHQLETDEEAQKLIQAFLQSKEAYEDLQRFGRYHPDYQEMMKKIRRTKRTMDMHHSVAQFKIAERNLQRFLDDISDHIAKSVSDNIMVPKDDLALSSSGCSSGGCGSGGSCGCQAS